MQTLSTGLDCACASYFEEALPKSRQEFDGTIKEFKAAAEVILNC